MASKKMRDNAQSLEQSATGSVNYTLESRSLAFAGGASDHACEVLGLRQRSLAISEANKVARLFNDGKRRLVDFSGCFTMLRHAFDEGLHYAIGHEPSSEERETIANKVASEIKSFIEGASTSRVIVREAVNSSGDLYLATVEKSAQDISSASLLIPTGEFSSRVSEEIFLRIDVERTRHPRKLFSAKAVLFTDIDGRSLAGLADIPDYLHELPNASFAFDEVFEGQADVQDMNARIYEAWWKHTELDPSGDTVLAPLGHIPSTGEDVVLHLNRLGPKEWTMKIAVAGELFALAEIAPNVVPSVDFASLRKEQGRLVRAVCADRYPMAKVETDHIFGQHLEDRFPVEFQELASCDPKGAVALFDAELEASIERLRKDPSSWKVMLFHHGDERRLLENGDVIASNVDICGALYLTPEDKCLKRASVYIVAAFVRKPAMKEPVLSYCTVLTPEQVDGNVRRLTRAIRNAA